MKGFLRILVRALACLLFIHRIQLKNLASSAVGDPALRLTIRPDVPACSCSRDPPSPGRRLLRGGWSVLTEPQLLQTGQLSKPACYIREEMTLAKSVFPIAPVRCSPQDLCACHRLTQALGAGVHPELPGTRTPSCRSRGHRTRGKGKRRTQEGPGQPDPQKGKPASPQPPHPVAPENNPQPGRQLRVRVPQTSGIRPAQGDVRGLPVRE